MEAEVYFNAKSIVLRIIHKSVIYYYDQELCVIHHSMCYVFIQVVMN